MANFIKDDDGRIVAIDFGVTCFLPPSFFAFVLHRRDRGFARLIAKKVKYPESTDVEVMSNPSYALVPYGTNEVGEQIFLLHFLPIHSEISPRTGPVQYITDPDRIVDISPIFEG